MDAVSIASSSDISGKRSAKRLASIVLPVPGGPRKSRLCCPAAAIVKARLACCCPIISVRSRLTSGVFSSLCCGMSWATGSVSRRLRKLTTCNSEWAKCVLALETSEASFAFCLAKIIWRFAFSAEITAGIAPCTPRKEPVRANSPKNSKRLSKSESICPDAARIPMAIGKSKRPPSFGKSAGARLMVMRCGG